MGRKRREEALPPDVVRVLNGWAWWSKSRTREPDPDGALLRDFLLRMFDVFLDLTSRPTGSLKPDPTYQYVAFILAAQMELVLGTGQRLRVGVGFDGPTLQRLLALLEEGRP